MKGLHYIIGGVVKNDFDPSTVEYEYKDKALKTFEKIDEVWQLVKYEDYSN